MTLVLTSILIGLCFWVRRHYETVKKQLRQLEAVFEQEGRAEQPTGSQAPAQSSQPTAVLLVGRYGGLGIHSLIDIQRLFPKHFKNYLFVSIGVIDAVAMKGTEEVEHVRERTEADLQRYVGLARHMGLSADYRMGVGIDALSEAETLCAQIAKKFPRAMFFASKLIFEEERWYQRLLHNETAYQIQRRLQFAGLHSMVLPVRVFTDSPLAPA